MGIYNRLFGKNKQQDEEAREEQIDVFVRRAEEAAKISDTLSCMNILREAFNYCRTPEETMYLLGMHRSAPNRTKGIVGVADCAILFSKNVDFTFSLLELIETKTGTGPCLSEVWFSLYQEAIIQGKYDYALEAYRQCLRCQHNKAGLYRIDTDLLIERAREISNRFANDLNRVAEINNFIAILPKFG